MYRLVVGISGASGMPLAQAVLENLGMVPDLEVHLMISKGSEQVLQAECGLTSAHLRRHAHAAYEISDMAAGPSSGSWRHDGMLVCPCSMSSLASIANGTGINLLHRAGRFAEGAHAPPQRRKPGASRRNSPMILPTMCAVMSSTERGRW